MSSQGPVSPPPVILHVDDDEANRYAVSRSLRKAGFEVIEAADGRGALDLLRRRPDLVILDVQLPDMHGFEVCRRIKADPATASTPVLHLSASFTTGTDKAHGLDGGADAYLIRPVEPVELIATVNALIRARRSEEALRESEERYRRLVEGVRDYAIFTTDPAGLVTSWNAGAQAVTGFAEADILGRSASILFTPEDVAGGAHEREIAEAASNGTAPDVRWHMRKDGTRFYANGVTTALRGPAGELLGFAKVARDETDRRVIEQANAGLAAMVRASRDAMFELDLDGTVRSWNPAAERLFGYRSTEMLGETASALTPGDRAAESAAAFDRARRGEAVEEFETVRVCKDGRPLDVVLSLTPIVDRDGRVTSVAATVRDVSERRRVEQERQRLLDAERAARQQAEASAAEAEASAAEAGKANRLKDEFLATLSHELRTPLNAIVGWASILSGRRSTADGRPAVRLSDADLAEGAEAIQRNARAQAQLIEDLLDVSRIISGKLPLDVRRVDLAATVAAAIGAVQPAADNKGVRVQRLFDPSVADVWGDAARLQQVVWNLVSNAIKFTPRGGSISVRISRVNSHVGIAVEDTGKGIAADFLPYVFDRFRQADATTTRRFGGLGLGLAIVRHLVELHGGTVRAQSDGEGRGATFTVELPVTAVDRPADGGTPAPRAHAGASRLDDCPEPNLAGLRVLVVDDEADARLLLKRILEHCDVVATLCASADEALGLLRSEQFDVLISDVGMPGHDGYELIQKLRAMSPEGGGRTPAIALTAFARAEDRRRALMAGFQIHVPKPVDPAELLSIIANLAGRVGG